MTIEYKYYHKKFNDLCFVKYSKKDSSSPINDRTNEKENGEQNEINRYENKSDKKNKKHKKEKNDKIHHEKYQNKTEKKASGKKQEKNKQYTNINFNTSKNSISEKKKENYIYGNTKEIFHTDKIKSLKENKKEEKQDTRKYNHHNHIWHRHHSKTLKEKQISNLDDDISSLEFGWTKKSEIVLPDLRKKEENVYFENETNENLTNKDFILETLSDYTSDFDECYINEFIDKHKYVSSDNLANKNEVLQAHIEEHMETVKFPQINSRTITFAASFDKYKNIYGVNDFYALRKTLRFADTIELYQEEYETETEKEYGKNIKSKEQNIYKFKENNSKNEDLLSDGIKHYDKKKKNSIFYKSKIRIVSMVDYVKRKLSLFPFTKKNLPQVK